VAASAEAVMDITPIVPVGVVGGMLLESERVAILSRRRSISDRRRSISRENRKASASNVCVLLTISSGSAGTVPLFESSGEEGNAVVAAVTVLKGVVSTRCK